MQEEAPMSCTIASRLLPVALYHVIAFYHLIPIENPALECKLHKEFLKRLDVKARIYISTQGINAQMSATIEAGKAYMDWLKSRPNCEAIDFKLQTYHEHVFPRLTVKVRKELVALGQEVPMTMRGNYLSPTAWREMLENDEEKVILDVRNVYEWKLGHFKGAELLPCETFREFTQSVADLKQRIDANRTKVLMYCTGGIRCELFSSLLKQEGIENVFQLHGGIIRYGEEEKSKHWLGKLFVFDDRLAVDLSNESAPVIGKCRHCGEANETYYNCANMDCNELFLCCQECLQTFQGCCHENCKSAKRVRPYQFSHKPFRRWYHYAKTKDELSTLTLQKECN